METKNTEDKRMGDKEERGNHANGKGKTRKRRLAKIEKTKARKIRIGNEGKRRSE